MRLDTATEHSVVASKKMRQYLREGRIAEEQTSRAIQIDNAASEAQARMRNESADARKVIQAEAKKKSVLRKDMQRKQCFEKGYARSASERKKEKTLYPKVLTPSVLI